MDVIRIQPIPAKDLVFPFIRGLAGIFGCVEVLGRSGQTALPEAAQEEWQRLFRYLGDSLQQLCREVAAAKPEEQSLLAQMEALSSVTAIVPDTIRELNAFCGNLAALCRCHKAAFRAAHAAGREAFGLLFRQIVGGRDLLLLYGSQDRAAAESIRQTMESGCFYDVESASLADFNRYRDTDRLTAVYSTRPAELNQLLRAAGPAGIDVALVDLGEQDMTCSPSLARQAMSLRNSDIRVVYRPFATIRLLQELERITLQRLLVLSRTRAMVRGAKAAVMRPSARRSAGASRRHSRAPSGRN